MEAPSVLSMDYMRSRAVRATRTSHIAADMLHADVCVARLLCGDAHHTVCVHAADEWDAAVKSCLDGNFYGETSEQCRILQGKHLLKLVLTRLLNTYHFNLRPNSGESLQGERNS